MVEIAKDSIVQRWRSNDIKGVIKNGPYKLPPDGDIYWEVEMKDDNTLYICLRKPLCLSERMNQILKLNKVEMKYS